MNVRGICSDQPAARTFVVDKDDARQVTKARTPEEASDSNREKFGHGDNLFPAWARPRVDNILRYSGAEPAQAFVRRVKENPPDFGHKLVALPFAGAVRENEGWVRVIPSNLSRRSIGQERAES